MPKSKASSRSRKPIPPLLHHELWVAARKNRARINATLRKAYGIAREITQGNGGFGPWTFLVNPDPPSPKTVRLRSVLGLREQEDLWVELTFYPNKTRMKQIIRSIWKHPGFLKAAGPLDTLVSRRKKGYDATLAYALLQRA